MAQASAPVLERISAEPGDNVRRTWSEAFRTVRGGDRAPRGAAVGRGPGRAVDGGREPDQMASRAHHLVLRAVPAQAARAGLSRVRRALRASCSTPITSPPGPRHARPERGLITRPNADEVAAYRAHVDRAVRDAAATAPTTATLAKIVPLIEIGLHHEQQHQELLWTDILHAFAQNPTASGLRSRLAAAGRRAAATAIAELPAGIRSIGFDGDGFCFDNEQPAHQVLLREAVIARHLVTNGEWLEFMADGGYARARSVAVGRLGQGRGRGLGRAGLLARDRRRLVHADARGLASRSIRRRRSATSATTRPTRSRAGPASTCRARPNGRSRPAPACSPTPSAWLGNGRAAPICPIRAIAPPKARSASTTASS